MDWAAECAVVIPCFNEGLAIAELVRSVRVLLPQVLVVNDGSTDQTRQAALEAGALVLDQPRRLGKGAALRRGFDQARTLGCNWGLAMDGDGQHAPGDIPQFLKRAASSKADLIVGNRMDNPGPMPFVRRAANRWMSRRISRLANQPLPDSQCGFRLIRLQLYFSLPLHTDHFETESETLLAATRAGAQVEFVPIQVLYGAEQSKINPLQDTLRWFKWWTAERKKKQNR